MFAAKVEMGCEQRGCRFQVFDFLGEAKREACKSPVEKPDTHPFGVVLLLFNLGRQEEFHGPRRWMSQRLEQIGADQDGTGQTASGIRCITCFSDMVCEEKDLHERDGSDQVLFIFICPKCDSRRAFYEDGAEYRRKKALCTQYQSEAKIEYEQGKTTS